MTAIAAVIAAMGAQAQHNRDAARREEQKKRLPRRHLLGAYNHCWCNILHLEWPTDEDDVKAMKVGGAAAAFRYINSAIAAVGIWIYEQEK